VRGYLPKEFENDCVDEEMGGETGLYIFMEFMRGNSAKKCADAIVKKLGIDDGVLEKDNDF